MSEDQTEYKMQLCETEEIPAWDDLCIGSCVCGEILVSGTGEYHRGEILMSSGNNVFTKATVSGIASASEVCVLSDDLEIEEDASVVSAGYFLGVYNAKRIRIGEEFIEWEDMPALRAKGIYVR